MKTFGLMNVLHLPSASGITRGNIGRAMTPSKVTAHPAYRERRAEPSLCRHEIKVKLCQKPLSKQDECVRTLPSNRVISLQTAQASMRPIYPWSHVVRIDSPIDS